MTDRLKQAYQKLTDYITRHKDIEISESAIRLPAEVRHDFYEHFNTVRDALIAEKVPILLEAGNELSRNFIRIEAEVTEMLRLDEINMDTNLQRFLHNPADEMRRGIFNLLFDFLKAKINDMMFEHKAIQSTITKFRPLFHAGYEKWVVLALVKLLVVDKLLQVDIPNFSSNEEQSQIGSGLSKKYIPSVEKSKNITFKNWSEAALIIPDLIVHSTKTNSYIGIRSQCGKALSRALETSKKRKWYALDSITPINLDITLVYMANDPIDIFIVADVDRICRPDAIIITKELNKWYETESLGIVKPYHYTLKPKLSTYVVSREIVGELKSEEQEDGIHIISTGYDSTKLQPIVDAMAVANR